MRDVSTRGLAEGQELITLAPVRATCVPFNFPVGTLLKIYVKNLLKIDSINRLTCFYEL